MLVAALAGSVPSPPPAEAEEPDPRCAEEEQRPLARESTEGSKGLARGPGLAPLRRRTEWVSEAGGFPLGRRGGRDDGVAEGGPLEGVAVPRALGGAGVGEATPAPAPLPSARLPRDPSGVEARVRIPGVWRGPEPQQARSAPLCAAAPAPGEL